jgi:SAM-dependent methyltransferase
MKRASSFDSVAEEYEAARPSYPPELLAPLPVPRSATVLDLAAGTGKLTRVLVQRYSEVIAVEPLAGMRAVLQRVVPGVEALAGSAERIPLDDGSVDAVFVAQAFHWFDKPAALGEIARVLRSGGVFANIWNGPDDDAPNPLPAEYLAELDVLHNAVEHPWKAEPDTEELLAATGMFVDIHERRSVPHDHVLDRAGVLDNARSVSWVASRDDRDEVIERLGALLSDETYAIPNLANIVWAKRK